MEKFLLSSSYQAVRQGFANNSQCLLTVRILIEVVCVNTEQSQCGQLRHPRPQWSGELVVVHIETFQILQQAQATWERAA